MSRSETDVDADYEQELEDHYGASDLAEEILDAMAAAGTDVDSLTRADIASIDEFHIRGQEATRELARLADLSGDTRVLDVGCGVGGPARTLAGEFDCDVVGVDVVEEYCRTATVFSERVGIEAGVEFRYGNALDLPFEDGAFDVVWVEHVLLNIADKRRAFEEARRVLGPGGTLALYDIFAGGGGDPVFPVPWAADTSLSCLEPTASVLETLRESGFETVTCRNVTEESLEWFREVVASMESRPPDAPKPLGLNLLMGEEAPVKAKNVVRCLEEDRIDVVQGVFEVP